MKKVLLLALVFLLTGCGGQETFETVEDWYYTPVISMGQVEIDLPNEAAVSAHSDGGSIYLCDGYSVCLQTMEAGDLDRTLQAVSGFPAEQLQLMQTSREGIIRYDFVWAAAGEGGDQVCRGAVLDDGNYHYTLCVMAQAETAGDLEERWQEIFASFSLDSSA